MQYETMDIFKSFQDRSVAEIEAYIQEEVNKRDAMNVDLLALNFLRDLKVKTGKREAAVAAFKAEHGDHPDQVIAAGPVIAAPRVSGLGGLGGFGQFLSKLLGRG